MKPLHTWLSAPGFLGTGAARGSDLLVLGLLLLILTVSLGLHAARQGHFRRHAGLMAAASIVLLTVVGLFTSWTHAGGAREGRPLPTGLLPLHLTLAGLGLLVLMPTAGLGIWALGYRTGRPWKATAPTLHRRAGFLTAALLTTCAGTGLLVYAWKYLGR